MAYLLDANVFISAKNLHYGFDRCRQEARRRRMRSGPERSVHLPARRRSGPKKRCGS